MSSIKYGKENEKVAIKQLKDQDGTKIEPCGLFIVEDEERACTVHSLAILN